MLLQSSGPLVEAAAEKKIILHKINPTIDSIRFISTKAAV
jgi:hypothetical protein